MIEVYIYGCGGVGNELAENLLKNAEATYLELEELYNYERVNCVENSTIRNIEDINDEVYEKVKRIIKSKK